MSWLLFIAGALASTLVGLHLMVDQMPIGQRALMVFVWLVCVMMMILGVLVSYGVLP